MRSNQLLFSIVGFCLMIGLTACGPLMPSGANLVGDELSEMSSLTSDTGQHLQKIALFDSTVGRIHQFSIGKMSLQRSVSVRHANIPHTVLYNPTDDYIVDLTTRHLSIFDADGRATHDPIKFIGTPISASFRPSLGYLVIYDSLSNVILMKLGASGQVLKIWTGGPVLNGASIAAGDIDASGRLVLAMSNGSISLVDIEQSLDQQQWVFTNFMTTLSGFQWLAPVRGQPDQVILATLEEVAILDVGSQTILDEWNFYADGWRKAKYSKNFDPHIVLKKGNQAQIIHAWGGALASRSLFTQVQLVVNSKLDLANDFIAIINADNSNWTIWDSTPAHMKNRVIKKWRFSDLRAMTDEKLPNKAKFEIAERSVFALYPSSLGLAVNFDLIDGEVRRLENFNLPFIQ